jgi:multisubunit Na+/H+ antiporter MnhB subunit
MVKFRFAPLSGGYMAASILGIFISMMYVYEKSPDWGVTFTVIFGIMFIASVVSMTAANPNDFIELETKGKKKKNA